VYVPPSCSSSSAVVLTFFFSFADHDTQISRLGGVNFPSLPINRSVCPFISTSASLLPFGIFS
jgi:catalase